MTTVSPRLVGRDLTVRFGAVTAIEGVSLHVSGGTLLAVVGHSGAGKSTLLGTLAGAVRPTSGEVVVGTTPVTDRGTARREGVTVIPQGNALVSVLTAYENCMVALRGNGVPGREARRRALEALAEVGLEDSRDHLVEELSGGQQQRVAVARGLAMRAPVLLADEPTSELDHGNRERVLDLLVRHAGAGAVVVMATHDLDAAGRAGRVLELDDGRTVAP